MRCTTRMRTDDADAAFLLFRYTSWGGGGVKDRVTPEVIGRSGQRAAIVNETHRSHQMLTFDWRRGGPGFVCDGHDTWCAACHVTASVCICLPPLTFSSTALQCSASSKTLLSCFFYSPPVLYFKYRSYAKPDLPQN